MLLLFPLQASSHSRWNNSPLVGGGPGFAASACTPGFGSANAAGMWPSVNWIVGKPLAPTSPLGGAVNPAGKLLAVGRLPAPPPPPRPPRAGAAAGRAAWVTCPVPP